MAMQNSFAGHYDKPVNFTYLLRRVDAFVKVTMTCRGQKISKKKTSIKYSTSSPVFNEAMTFDVPQHIVEEVSLIVNVLHHGRCDGTPRPLLDCSLEAIKIQYGYIFSLIRGILHHIYRKTNGTNMSSENLRSRSCRNKVVCMDQWTFRPAMPGSWRCTNFIMAAL